MRKPRKECKGSDRYHDRNHADNKEKHFFKVLVGNFRERLTIPDKFVQHFTARSEGMVTLESCSGYTFDVEVTKNLGKLVFQTGWKAFVSAHDLKMGDFLVFKYDGFSQFKVLIFDSSCCEKELSCRLVKTAICDEEMSGESIEIRGNYVELPMKSPKSNRKAWMQRERSMLINIISSSSELDSSGYFSSSEDQKPHDVPRYILPKRTKLTHVQKMKLNEKVRGIHSEIPIYVSVMKKSSIVGRHQSMNISKKYSDVYLPFEDETLLLRRHGKSWEVRCCIQKGKVSSKRFLKGWKLFARDNHLRPGDLCLFEQVKNKKQTMNVHIIR